MATNSNEIRRQRLRMTKAQLIDELERLEHGQDRQDSNRAHERLQEAIDVFPDGFVLYDNEDRLVLYNQKYSDIYAGHSEFFVIGNKFEKMLRAGVKRGDFPEASGREEQWIGERVYNHQNPSLAPFEQKLANGTILLIVERRTKEGGIVGIRRDITESKRAEQALRSSEERFRDIAESSSDWFWEMGPDLKFTYLTESIRKIVGIDPQDLIGKTRHEWTLEDTKPEKWESHLSDLENHRPFRDFQYEVLRPDGKTRLVSVSGKPVFDEAGEFIGYRGSGTNITEQILAERRADEALQVLESAIESIDDAFVLFDANDRLVMSNSKYREFYKDSIDLIVPGNKFEDMIRGSAERGQYLDAIGRVDEWVAERMAAHRTADSVVEQELDNGRWLKIAERRTPDGGTVGLRVDITDMKKAMENAEKANKAKSEFLASMSHELRTPMNAILGFTQFLQYNPKEPLSETQNSSVDLILRGGNHLLELIEQVLELSKIEAGHLSLNVDHTLARDVINQSLSLIQARADREGIKIIDRIDRDALPFLWTDSTRLMQVLLNLLSNAVKYNRENGTVTLTCQEIPDRMLRISVADTGSGIPLDKHDELFKPFERLGLEAGTIEGTGIGLTITRQIIELLGGHIDFESEEGKGSTFWIDVPISAKQDLDAVNVHIAASTGRMIKELDETGSQFTILYIEDNPTNMQLMEMMIGRIANTKLLTAYNAELGLDLAKSAHPDLILMDINLPGLNVIEAMKQLQDTTITKNIPVIAITTTAIPKNVQDELKAGFRDYITKPIDVPKFIRIIGETLDSIKKPA